MKTGQLANIYDTLKKKCKKAGTDLTEVCRDAGVDRSVPERWKKENPKTLDTVVKLIQAIENKQKQIMIPAGGKEKVTR